MSKHSKILVSILLILLFLWSTLIMVDFSRLRCSIDAGKRPLITLGSTQIQDELAVYHGLGCTQRYELTEGDQVVYGEFSVLGLKVSSWTRSIPDAS